MRRTVRKTYQDRHCGMLLVTLLAVFVMYSLVGGLIGQSLHVDGELSNHLLLTVAAMRFASVSWAS